MKLLNVDPIDNQQNWIRTQNSTPYTLAHFKQLVILTEQTQDGLIQIVVFSNFGDGWESTIKNVLP